MATNGQTLTTLLAEDVDAGFTELVRIHASTVHAYLHRVSGSAADADDLGQDTLLRAYTALRTYPPQRRRDLHVRTWLLTIATNVWRNHVRTRTRRPDTVARLDEAAGAWADDAPGPEEHAANAEQRRRLVIALTELPERHRIPVVLRHIVGLSYAEVAQVQGCPVGTAKAQVARGVVSLRSLLGDTDSPEEVTA
ncbi:RNA polymerase sigma factor [Plantactinospora sp. KBS50]|uniref:RNA polymerase sigma factor n=1 Tax=Plantactinospora sp. KBS50 TaxID=2024580 RepID=UPI000BAA9884|nr:RNA polymerase sigma factor [Plantactinospora sp. KBS50]ASW57371.1 RNA polymerase subunit sigma-24 [Plantactinospora sp. KBS50]